MKSGITKVQMAELNIATSTRDANSCLPITGLLHCPITYRYLWP
jgi:hypothetical protein